MIFCPEYIRAATQNEIHRVAAAAPDTRSDTLYRAPLNHRRALVRNLAQRRREAPSADIRNPDSATSGRCYNNQQRYRINDPFGGALPHNIEAEQCLLGAILINNEAFGAIGSIFDAEDFFELIHQKIFKICEALIGDGKVVSPITVKTFLPADLDVAGLTCNQYLARLCAEATTIINAADYANVVRDLADRRHMIAAAEEVMTTARTAAADVPVKELAAAATRAFGKLAEDRMSRERNRRLLHNTRPLTAAEFLKLALPPRERILAPWLPVKGLAMIYSPRGVGKTLFGMASAYAIAAGGTFLGFDAFGKPRKVLYIDGEMPSETMQERLAAIVSAFPQQPPTDDYFRLLSSDLSEVGLPDLGTAEGQAWMDTNVCDAEVLFVDNISTLVRSGKENEAEGWLPVQNWVLAHRRAGRAVVLLHHAGKGGTQRGTSRREDVLDTVIALRHPGDYSPEQGARFEVHFEKTRGSHGTEARPRTSYCTSNCLA
jgi:hypothetical protein